MELNPIVHFPLFIPLSWYGVGPFDTPDLSVIRNESLIFQLRRLGNDWYYYTCMQAYEASGHEKDSSSPNFKPWKDTSTNRLLIPDDIQKWFQDFTRMMMVGAGWGRKYFPKVGK